MKMYLESHLSRGAWIEMKITSTSSSACKSHLSRGAWIEIDKFTEEEKAEAVAPLTGCVD